MTWKKERDLLIAQTMAFVQSVTGKTPDADRSFENLVAPPSSQQPAPMDRPADVLPSRLTPISHPLIQGDMRDEIGRRVAAFRARQQAFARDRNDYCNAVMTKVRAEGEEAAKARDNQPPKR